MPRLTAVILAAGQGTRMRSKTPKMLHDLCGWPLVRWPVEAARGAGADTVVVVGGPDRALEGELPEGAELAVQEVARGTGDAVVSAREYLDEGTVVVLNGDVPLITPEAIADLARAHEERGAAATMVTMILDDPGQYGRVVRDAQSGDVVKVVEAKADGDATPEELALREVNTGVFAFDGPKLAAALAQVTPDNAQGEYYLPDVLPILRAQGDTVAAHVVDDAAITLGINDRVDLAAVRALAQRRIQEQHMLAGVTIVDPASTTIDQGVAIGEDTTIEPFTSLRGRTRIGAECTVGPHVHVIDSTLEDGVRIGPFVHLRGNTVLRRNARAGTFVEMKNSDVGEGSKVPHLSYLGDADVGANTNVAAANVTANYDGRDKHRTTIGANVKTGVDNTFVAPVTIGDNAVIAAGSVITEDVPEDALGVARAPQRNIDGYARRPR
jgi:bifunctional UDP-N-acetylglucosamine pyrophosphorylase/glucosamine-1-phosphate N-acetyltransferase